MLLVLVIIENRKVRYDYHILETFQAGLSLSGKMTKALRSKEVRINSAFVVYQNLRLEIVGLQHKDLVESVPLLLNKKEKNKIILN